MRYYFMNQEMKDFSLDVEMKSTSEMEFTHEGKKQTLKLKKLAGKTFYSFDGIAWKQIRFPSDMLIYNVCCGGDGAVYIAGHGGTVFRGRGDQWSKICEGIASYWFNDMVWYQDKVWGTNDYGICAFNENGEQKLDLPDFVRSSTGYMAQGDGVLVIAGMYGASMYDGTKWSSLVDLVDLYKKYGRES